MSDDSLYENAAPPPVTNTGSAAESEIDIDYKAIAEKKIRRLAHGNGVKKDEIAVEYFKGATLEFIATTTLKIKTRVLERKESGQKTGPLKISGPQQLREEITREEHKITHNHDLVRRIQDFVIENRKDIGYGLDGHLIKVPFLTKDFVQYEPCQNCRAKGQIPCQRCGATGQELCPKCHGQGLEVCSGCMGGQFIQGPKGRQQCPRCMGRGKTGCGQCHEKKKIQCRMCQSRGATPCGICNGHAWNSIISRLEVDFMPEFDYDKTAVENRIGEAIDQYGPKLVEHADIRPIISVREDKDDHEKRDFVVIPYHVALPHGELGFSIQKNMYNVMIFGKQCSLMYMPNFLETLIKPGITRLHEAAENRGNVAEKIKKAARYKLIRESILAAAMTSPRNAMKKIRSTYPMAITSDNIHSIIMNADAALKNITYKPRQIGFLAGLVLMALLYAAYFIGPGRVMAASHIPEPPLRIGLDILIGFAGFYAGLSSIRLAGWHALRGALKGLVPAGQERKFMPKAGKTGEHMFFIAIPVYFAIIEASRHVHPNAPEWYLSLLEKFLPAVASAS